MSACFNNDPQRCVYTQDLVLLHLSLSGRSAIEALFSARQLNQLRDKTRRARRSLSDTHQLLLLHPQGHLQLGFQKQLGPKEEKNTHTPLIFLCSAGVIFIIDGRFYHGRIFLVFGFSDRFAEHKAKEAVKTKEWMCDMRRRRRSVGGGSVGGLRRKAASSVV
ncbi:uncharacterized protein V6R79_007977 [Siganus canaliculatus]